jgi:hypothetical protein
VVDFSPFQYENYTLENPEITLVFPHVEESRKKVICHEVESRETILRNLFNSASEKLGKSILLYGKMALPGLDTVVLSQNRQRNLEKFMKIGKFEKSLLWISGVKEVMDIV